jgi:hypothetical protein
VKFWIITIIIGAISVASLGIGLFIYRMPYPFKLYFHNLRNGPAIEASINWSDFKVMWGTLKGKRLFYEIPIEVKYEDVEIISIRTLMEHNGYDGSGRSYRFTLKEGSWIPDPSVEKWVN